MSDLQRPEKPQITSVEYQHLGYFEEFVLLHPDGTAKGIGSRILPVELPPEHQGRTLGAYGRRDFEVTETITLSKGHRQVTYKASTKKPLKVCTFLSKLEGRRIE